MDLARMLEMSSYVDNPSRVWVFDFENGPYATAEGLGTSLKAVTVKNVHLYSYKDLDEITREELFVWILIDKILEQFTGTDIAAAAAILSGQPFIPTRTKFGGSTSGTSPASVLSRKLLNKQMPFRLPTITGKSLRTLRISMAKNFGAWAGRTVPIVGWAIMSYDVEEIIRKTLTTYNKIARDGDKLW